MGLQKTNSNLMNTRKCGALESERVKLTDVIVIFHFQVELKMSTVENNNFLIIKFIMSK